MKKILIVSGGERAYREYGLCSISEHYHVYLLADRPPSWELDYIDDHRSFDPAKRDDAIETVRAWHAQERFDGVMTYSELFVELAAEIAAGLGLPGNSAETARRCRDKHVMRAALASAGVPSARSLAACTLDEAIEAAATIGFPVVVKPRSLGGSIGVVLAHDQATLERAFAVAVAATYPGAPAQGTVLIEEYLDGPEVSVESVVIGGKVHCVAITEKSLGFEPYFEEVGHQISPGEPLSNADEVQRVVSQAHVALGVSDGITHSELRLTSRGPAIVEVGARLGGDLIPYLARLATGVDMARAAAELACGNVPDLEPKRCVAAAIRFLYPENDGSFVSWWLDPSASDEADSLNHIEMTASAGDVLRLPPSDFGARLGFVVVIGRNRAECALRLNRFQNAVAIEMKTLAER